MSEKNVINEVLSERGSRYGGFTENSELTQKLNDLIVSHPKYELLSNSHRETLHMIFHKISRMVNGDNNYTDNLIDIIGYSQLLLNEIENKNKR